MCQLRMGGNRLWHQVIQGGVRTSRHIRVRTKLGISPLTKLHRMATEISGLPFFPDCFPITLMTCITIFLAVWSAYFRTYDVSFGRDRLTFRCHYWCEYQFSPLHIAYFMPCHSCHQHVCGPSTSRQVYDLSVPIQVATGSWARSCWKRTRAPETFMRLSRLMNESQFRRGEQRKRSPLSVRCGELPKCMEGHA